jgi:hypothetical protein
LLLPPPLLLPPLLLPLLLPPLLLPLLLPPLLLLLLLLLLHLTMQEICRAACPFVQAWRHGHPSRRHAQAGAHDTTAGAALQRNGRNI